MTISLTGDARQLLGEVAAAGGNMLVTGTPGSGKTTLLKQLVTSPAGRGSSCCPSRSGSGYAGSRGQRGTSCQGTDRAGEPHAGRHVRTSTQVLRPGSQAARPA
jgi:hypothetical protein